MTKKEKPLAMMKNGDEEDEDDSGSDSEAISAAHLAELKQKVLEHFAFIESEYGK